MSLVVFNCNVNSIVVERPNFHSVAMFRLGRQFGYGNLLQIAELKSKCNNVSRLLINYRLVKFYKIFYILVK